MIFEQRTKPIESEPTYETNTMFSDKHAENVQRAPDIETEEHAKQTRREQTTHALRTPEVSARVPRGGGEQPFRATRTPAAPAAEAAALNLLEV